MNKDNTQTCYNCSHWVNFRKDHTGVIKKKCSVTNEETLKNDPCSVPNGFHKKQ